MLSDLVREGTCTQVDNFLRNKSNIDPDDLANALSIGAFRGDCAIVQLLLDFGADPNARPSGHWPAIYCAIEQQALNMVRLLAKHGADVNLPIENGFTPLHLAVDIEGDSAWQRGESASAELTALMLALGANPRTTDSSGNTPLNIAERYEHSRAIELLRGNL
jgi:ankyrin repeat protein